MQMLTEYDVAYMSRVCWIYCELYERHRRFGVDPTSICLSQFNMWPELSLGIVVALYITERIGFRSPAGLGATTGS
jgi:hypothetical protein